MSELEQRIQHRIQTKVYRVQVLVEVTRGKHHHLILQLDGALVFC